MSHVAMGKYLLISVGLAVALGLSSCGQSSHSKAQSLYDEAQAAYEKGEWDTALAALADIDSLYKGEIEVRRQGRVLRPQIIEKQSLEKLSRTDSLLAVNQWIGDSLTHDFRIVNNALERYYVTKNAPMDINTRPGLYGRMSPDGVLYFVAVSPKVSADQILFDGVASGVLPHDGERCDRIAGNQILTFLEGEFSEVILAIAHAQERPVELTFLNGGNKTGKITLTVKDVEALSQACQTAVNLRTQRLLMLEKEKLEKTITVARNQIARTMPEPAE